jgi:DNA polymerase-3 subunit chi
MVDVSFHTHVADVPAYAYRLLRKATMQGTRVLVVTPEPVELGRYLWSASATDFIPHVVFDAPPAVELSGMLEPIVLTSEPESNFLNCVWLNLSAAWLKPAPGCQRIIDIVADDAQQLQQGRLRWRQYAQMGCGLTNHDARVPS